MPGEQEMRNINESPVSVIRQNLLCIPHMGGKVNCISMEQTGSSIVASASTVMSCEVTEGHCGVSSLSEGLSSMLSCSLGAALCRSLSK